MKLIITKPEMIMHERSQVQYPKGMWYRQIFEMWLWENDIQTGKGMKMEWNHTHGFWDIHFFAEIGASIDFDKLEEFLLYLTKKDGVQKVEIADRFYEYESDRRKLNGIRMWIYPIGEYDE